ncbi:MAG: DUF1016 family protein [Nanoarchaeota archaeon]|nr:DUF1016 family protein [Nanoarchaeota archaeon]
MNQKLAMEQRLGYSYVKHGILFPGQKNRTIFPPINKPFLIVADNREYNVHLEGQNRISFKKWFTIKGKNVKPGDIVRLYEIEPMHKYLLEHESVDPSSTEEIEKNYQKEEIDFSMSLSIERDMKLFLLKKLDQLELGLKLYKEGDIDGFEFYTEEGVGRIDILAMDKDNNFVVIECKTSKTSDQTVGQINRYINWVKKNLAENEEVRGLIIANQFDKNIKWAIENLPYIKLKKYEVNFKFTDDTQKEELMKV